jgi:hypothetical protein
MSEFIEIPVTKTSQSQKKLVYGVGINDALYMTQTMNNNKRKICPYYRYWIDMMARCYSSRFLSRRPTYKNSSVCDEWLVFSSFKKWMTSQKWEGMQLDKDIKIIGNKTYSPDTCLFVSRYINTLLLNCAASRRPFPLGVTFDKRRNVYLAKCSYKSRTINIGRFDCPKKAHLAYKKYKNKVIIEAANQPENEYIKQYLLNHAAHLLGQTL